LLRLEGSSKKEKGQALEKRKGVVGDRWGGKKNRSTDLQRFRNRETGKNRRGEAPGINLSWSYGKYSFPSPGFS